TVPSVTSIIETLPLICPEAGRTRSSVGATGIAPQSGGDPPLGRIARSVAVPGRTCAPAMASIQPSRVRASPTGPSSAGSEPVPSYPADENASPDAGIAGRVHVWSEVSTNAP